MYYNDYRSLMKAHYVTINTYIYLSHRQTSANPTHYLHLHYINSPALSYYIRVSTVLSW